jgi:hypothetical protein
MSIHILAKRRGRFQIHPQQAKDQGKKIFTIPTTRSSTIPIPPPPAVDNQEEMGFIKIQPPPPPTTSTATLRKKHSDFHLILMAKFLIPGYLACKMMGKVSSTIIESRVNHALIYHLALLDSRKVDAHLVQDPERVWRINNV